MNNSQIRAFVRQLIVEAKEAKAKTAKVKTKKKISESLKNRWKTDAAYRQKMSFARKGNKNKIKTTDFEGWLNLFG